MGRLYQMDLCLARDRAQVFDAFSIAVASLRRVDRAPLMDRDPQPPSLARHLPKLLLSVWSGQFHQFAGLLTCS